MAHIIGDGRMGWVCPGCWRGWSPDVRVCQCCPERDEGPRFPLNLGSPLEAVSVPAIYVPLRADADSTPSDIMAIAHLLNNTAPHVIEGKFIVLPPGARVDDGKTGKGPG